MHSDPIADMLTRVRNANQALHPEVSMPSSKAKEEIAKILSSEGYLDGYKVEDAKVGKKLTVTLRYSNDRERVVHGIRRISSPGRRVYKATTELNRVRGGLGVSIVSTSDGLLTDREARRRKIGGEVLCEVW
ncbi:MAG: 30S ribosomal protein S8 [Acidimicrobiia bacterium]|nr:30S ribosomal protein S8 [Acidimicrobiia bacterium]MDX2466638.1 30S ribosomal protein S8 [Acidimicrobiia bacterium]